MLLSFIPLPQKFIFKCQTEREFFIFFKVIQHTDVHVFEIKIKQVKCSLMFFNHDFKSIIMFVG